MDFAKHALIQNTFQFVLLIILVAKNKKNRQEYCAREPKTKTVPRGFFRSMYSQVLLDVLALLYHLKHLQGDLYWIIMQNV